MFGSTHYWARTLKMGHSRSVSGRCLHRLPQLCYPMV